MSDPSGLEALKAALAFSPTNLPLRLHLAEQLLGHGQAEEAEPMLRAGLAIAPTHAGLRLALARAFFQQGALSKALVVLEDLNRETDVTPAARLLYARTLAAEGDLALARRAYERAVADDPSLEDAELAAHIDLEAAPGNEPERVPVTTTAIPSDGPLIALERPSVRFSDIGGLEDLKEEIRLKILYPLTQPELYAAYGKKTGGGVLMYGPPGCGKTHLARATAGEAGATFLPVGIHEVMEMWLGQSERNLHAVFEQARQNTPCVLFFDEVDALGASRGEMRHGSGRTLINQFLAELDGVQASNEGILVLGATNAPWHMDAGFRRPGRFDRVLFVAPPDLAGRAAILRLQLRGKPVDNIDVEAIARKTPQCSGADLQAVVDRAVESKLGEAIRAGKALPLTTADLLAAAKVQTATTREWFASAKNYATFANQGGLYDDVLHYLKQHP